MSLFIRSAAFQDIGVPARGGAQRDRVLLRDSAGRSSRPHLVAERRQGEPGVVARGPFSILLRYSVTKDEGVRFCRATGDANPIHSEGEVVPGAYTAAKVLLPIEVLFPEIEIAEFAVKFAAISEYGRPLATRVRCLPTAEGALFHAVTAHDGAEIAEIDVRARRADPGAPVPVVARKDVSVERVKTVRAFAASLRVAPHAYFRAVDWGWFYPRSYLASLPSGAMVRKLRGDGALLNKLALAFEGGPVAITRRDDPTVEIEQPRARRTFNKVLAAISDGLRTYVRGSALVLSRAADAATSVVRPAT